MTDQLAQTRPAAYGPDAGRSRRRARPLLAGGITGTALFFVVAGAQVAAHEDFDLGPHMLSQLAAGPYGWIQMANFIVTGATFVVTAAGIRGVLPEGPGRWWLPRLVAIFGAGLVTGGMMVADPAAGYPVGAAPQTTWHGIGHGVAAMVAGLALVGAILVIARIHARQGRRGLAAADVAVAALYLMGPYLYPAEMGTLFALGSAVAWSWMAIAALRLAPRAHHAA